MSVTSGTSATRLAGDQALTIAQRDAVTAYPDLSRYCIRLALEDDGWHVDYDLKGSRHKGGGPHYIIDPMNGTIVAKTYEQ